MSEKIRAYVDVVNEQRHKRSLLKDALANGDTARAEGIALDLDRLELERVEHPTHRHPSS